MTFRTQIHKKKFGKKCFRTLQGTMSHRPLTNTSSLKIAAAYCAYTYSGPFREAQISEQPLWGFPQVILILSQSRAEQVHRSFYVQEAVGDFKGV